MATCPFHRMAHPECQKCARWIYSAELETGICHACTKKQAELDALRRRYAGIRFRDRYDLRRMMIRLRRRRLSLRKIAYVLNMDLDDIVFEWDQAVIDGQ